MIRRTVMWVGVLALLTLMTAAWASAGGGRPAGTAPRTSSSTITLENNTGVDFTDNFNPFDSSSFVVSMAVRTLTYEPLFEWDTLKPGVVHNWLATAYKFTDGGKTLTFDLRHGVKWSDGTPFTSADVAFTFDLMQKYAAANYSGVPAQSGPATTSGDYTVSLHFTAPAYSDLYAISGTTYMVQKAQWSSISDPATATITNPVGTGPYVLDSYSSQLVVYKANPSYWDGTPAAEYVDVPYEASNSTASVALAAGEIDWAGNDIPSIKSAFIDKDPAHNHYYFAPGSTVALWFNVTKAPFNNADVRAAISIGINRDVLASKGETGYEAPATSSSGLILPNQAQYLTKSDTNDLPGKGDAKKLATLLEAAGYTKKGGHWEKDGKKLSFTIIDPEPYSDYYADEQLICDTMKADGVGCSYVGQTTSEWYDDLPVGDFQATIHWGAGGVSPFVQYQNWLDYSLSAPLGKTATADYGRYDSSAAQAALNAYGATDPTDTTALNKDIEKLASIMSSQVPVAPLLYGADWDEYSTLHFTGFPDASNPYMDPSPNDPELGYILMQLKKA